MNVPSYNPLACAAARGETITYRRDPELLGFAYPSPAAPGTTAAAASAADLNHVRDNTWTGVVLGCAAMPTSVPVGQVDPRTGEVVQAVYQVQNRYGHFSDGHIEVKASNVIDTSGAGPDATRGATADARKKGAHDSYLRGRWGAVVNTPSDLYQGLR